MSIKDFFNTKIGVKKEEKTEEKKPLTFADIPPEVVKQIEDQWYKNLEFMRLYQPLDVTPTWLPWGLGIAIVVNIIITLWRT